MAKKAKPIRTEFTDAEIAAKRAAGLTKDQALAVLQAQAEHDATDPHDEAPEAESAGEESSPKAKSDKKEKDAA